MNKLSHHSFTDTIERLIDKQYRNAGSIFTFEA
jgi:hypothetical protein